MPKGQMSKSDSSRIQSSQIHSYTCTCIDSATRAKAGGDLSSSGFAARAQSAADRHASSDTRAGGMNHAQPSRGNTKTSETSASGRQK
ncbi:hypothetical protein J3F84DRAFT_375163 [Trichoderma pleuroticola]